ncbi:EF-hand domain-containing protein [Nereida sp. MMG025]|uniref:EF-hand domain-containing protein n=1 Tax=Nereida sp. MMG025 TaxID=2909981 RepID=UPI001F21B801|nr:EF-hand domain-containing protein [Nereida sp. MMG025]MCF6443577.1 EF-hand domain-containing protein [Nereida sp. MMG025]
MTRFFMSAIAATLLATPVMAMTEIDTDGDGFLTLAEMQAAYPDMSEEMFTAIDTNGDGVVNAEEVSAAEDASLLPKTDG